MAETHIVARERELAALQGYLDRALGGHTQACFVTGEAGAGKTTLLQEFARRAQEAHPELVVALGQCSAQTRGGEAYLPFRTVLAELSGDVPAPDVPGTGKAAGARRLRDIARVSGATLLTLGPDLLGALLPGAGLAARIATTAAQHAGLSERLKLHGAAGEVDPAAIRRQYTRVLEALARHDPLIVALDDLQWADSASLELLVHLARELKGSRLLLAGTYRPAENEALERAVAEVERLLGPARVDLDGATQERGRAFVDAFLDREPNRLDEDFRRALFARTGGHPLFTAELWQALLQRADVVRDAGGAWIAAPALQWESLPAGVEGVIAERVARLPGHLRDLLATASVEGVEFTTQALALAHKLPERSVLRSLARELDRQHHLVGESNELKAGRRVLSRYRFTHGLFQQYLYGELSAAERRLLHGEVAGTLEALGAASPAVLAYHYERAGLLDKAAEYLERAGQEAQRAGALRSARALFERALALIDDDPPGRIRLTRRLGSALLGVSEFAEARVQLEASLALARAAGDSAAVASALGALGRLATETGRYGEAQALLGESLRLLGSGSRSPELISILKNLGMACVWQGQYAEGKAHLEASLALARELGDRAGEASALNHLGHLALDQHAYAEAQARVEESLALARSVGDRGGEAVSAFNLGMIARRQGEARAASGHLREALPLAREVGNQWVLAGVLSELAMAAADLDDERASAAAYAREALHTAQSIHALPIVLYALVAVARLHAGEGRDERAVELLALVLQHPANISGTRDVAEPLLEALRARTAAPAFEAAAARGRALALEAAVAQALAPPTASA